MHKISYILFLALCVASCKNDKSEMQSGIVVEHLIGEWGVVEATRNNREAKSLANAVFTITDTTFSCNFLDDSKSFPYSFDGKEIKVLNPKQNVYSVRSLTLDTLTFKTEIKNFDFKFISVKKNDNDKK